MAEQSNELLIDHHETYPIGSALFPKVNATTFDYIFMIVILIMDMVIKEISKTHFVIRSGTVMWKNGKIKMWKYWKIRW